MAGRAVARAGALASLAVALTACTVAPPEPRPVSDGHLSTTPPPAEQAAIPEPVKRRPFVPLPVPAPPEETFTVVVNQVPVRELLFALARDANINVDVHPDIDGDVTINAIDQSLNQILDRVTRQLAVRYENRDGTLVIVPDRPFLRTYRVDYVNVTRDGTGSIGATSSLEGEGQAQFTNTSSAGINTVTRNEFWQTLQSSIDEIVNPGLSGDGATGQQRVIVNREGGVILVRATAAQHELVQSYLDQVIASVSRQVLIEATIVEVELNDRYQAGIDWQIFTRQGGLVGAGLTLGTDVASAFTAGAGGAVTGLIFNAADAPTGSPKRNVEVSINLLNEFGDTKVLSSPKVMTLNNQPALLKVVDNEVYFEVDTELSPATQNTDAVVSLDTSVRTVSVGIVMNVTPQISESDQVTLNVRPTVSRIREFVPDPAIPVALAQSGIQNLDISNEIPVIAVRETETVLRVGSGQLAILGGLMQDSVSKDDESVPGFSELPVAGEAFNFRERNQVKSELVVFLRPTVIRTPDVEGDLAGFRRLLPENLRDFDRQKSPFVPVPGLEGAEGGNPQ